MRRPLWFKAKRYGWGWYPASWQGWLVLALYIGAMFFSAAQIDSAAQSLGHFIPRTIVLTVALLVITWLTGEKPGWHWGDKK